jgi:hypothetical protein
MAEEMGDGGVEGTVGKGEPEGVAADQQDSG